MRNKSFQKSFRNGLGRAILEIRNAEDKAMYIGDLTWFCLHDITFDLQCEGTKGLYIYDAICSAGNKNYYENTIITKYLSSKNEGYNIQSSEILLQYALDGSNVALEALWQKYNNILAGMKTKKAELASGYEWEDLAIRLSRVEGIPVVAKYLADIGNLICSGLSLEDFYLDWFLRASQANFGKAKINRCFNEIESLPGLQTIINYANKIQCEIGKVQRKKINVTFDEYYAKCASVIEERKYVPKYTLSGLGRVWAKNSGKVDQLKLAQFAVSEKDETLKSLLLLPFRHVRFPLPVALLLEGLDSQNKNLAEITIDVLSRIKNKMIYETGLSLLPRYGLDFVLKLFIKNFTPQVEQMIREAVLKRKFIDHGSQMALQVLFEKNHSATCGDILHHMYENCECGICRLSLVELLSKRGLLLDQLLLECTLDSNEEIREWALKRRNIQENTTIV